MTMRQFRAEAIVLAAVIIMALAGGVDFGAGIAHSEPVWIVLGGAALIFAVLAAYLGGKGVLRHGS